jgi:hypothetical protein
MPTGECTAEKVCSAVIKGGITSLRLRNVSGSVCHWFNRICSVRDRKQEEAMEDVSGRIGDGVGSAGQDGVRRGARDDQRGA